MVRVGDNENVGGAAKGRPHHRSPNYPLFDLGNAVEKAKKLYDADKTHKVPIGVVHERWGYKQLSASGNQAVAAMSSYGLIAVDGSGDARQIAVSESGRRIVLNASNRGELLKQAALGPALFKSLWDQYSDLGLPSDEVLRHYLVFERNFNEDVVDRVVERFKETVAFAGLVAGDKIEVADQDDIPTDRIPEKTEGKPVSASIPTNAGNAVIREFPIPLFGGGLAVVKVPVPMSAADFKQITDTLNAWKPTLVRERVSGRERAEAEHDPTPDDPT